MYIRSKRVGNGIYYYAVESKRIDGKPRTVWQKYLGKLEDIIKKLDQQQSVAKPFEAEISEFGSVAAMYMLAQRLGLVDFIDGHVPKRDQGATVGEYMLIAAINRAVDPKSKRQIGEWFDKTALSRILPHIKGKTLSSQRFWDHMDYLDAEKIRNIEMDITSHMVREFDLDLRTLIYDTTNFITYVDTESTSELPERGNSKQKRHDLKQVGLALMVTMDCHVPLFHEAYCGKRHDCTQFASVTEELVRRYQVLSQECEHITLVWDKGNNSKNNLKAFDSTPYHYVGSLVPSQHKDLLRVPIEDFRPLGGEFAGHQVYRTRKTVMEKDRLVLVVHNEALHLGQRQGLTAKMKKAVKALRELGKTLVDNPNGSRKRRPSPESIKKRVESILKGEHLKRLIHVIHPRPEDLSGFDFHVENDMLRTIDETYFGKTILFTDNEGWSDEEILTAYRGQASIEQAFKQMKDPHFVSWRPMFHWSDSKISVHAFYCVLALSLTSLLRRELRNAAIDQDDLDLDMSIDKSLETLSEIREIAHIYAPETKLPNHITLSKMDKRQRYLFNLLGLSKLQP